MTKQNGEKRTRRTYGSKEGESVRCKQCWGLIHDEIKGTEQRKCRNCGEVS